MSDANVNEQADQTDSPLNTEQRPELDELTAQYLRLGSEAMYPGEHGNFSVYRLDFPCGNAYVGMTGRMVRDRVEEHMGRGAFGSSNAGVGWEVQAHGEPAVSIIISGLSQDEARRWEVAAIGRTPRVLNSGYGVAEIDSTEACEDALTACGIVVDVVARWAGRRHRPAPAPNGPE